MTDLEITRLCAEAMGWKHLGAVGVPVPPDKRDASGLWCMSGGNDWWLNPEGHSVCGPCQGIPDPLHDDAQAMALVKKSKLSIAYFYTDSANDRPWRVSDGTIRTTYMNADLNRAICECVAMMQQNKDTA